MRCYFLNTLFFFPEKFAISLVYLSYYSLHKQNMNIISAISETQQSNKNGLSFVSYYRKTIFFSKKGFILPLLFSEIVRGDQNKLCCGTDVQRSSKRSTRCISKLKHSKSCSRLPAAALPASCTLCTLAVPPGAWRSVRCLIDLSPPRAGFVQSGCR